MPFGGESCSDTTLKSDVMRDLPVTNAFRRGVLFGLGCALLPCQWLRYVTNAFRRGVLFGPGRFSLTSHAIPHCHQCLSAGSPVRTFHLARSSSVVYLSPMPFGGESCSDKIVPRLRQSHGYCVTNAFRRGVLFGPRVPRLPRP